MIAAGAERAWELARRYEQQLEECVVLYAGTNYTSPQVRSALGAEMGSMPAMGRPWQKQQPGTSEISELEELVEQQLCRLFRATWAEARLPSATMGNLALYAAFCSRERPLMATSAQHGGHASFLADGTPSLLGLDVVEIPFTAGGSQVDESAAMAMLEVARPGLLLLGTALILNVEYPRRLIARARELGTVVAYDASHVAGLIAGGVVENPFDAGVEIVTASTYKSFAGPPGGVIVGRDFEHAELLRPIVCPKMTSNYDAGRVLAISIACSEAEQYMHGFASAMIAAADDLHAQLVAQDCAMAPRSAKGRTHQLFLDFGSEEQAKAAMLALERCNIIAGASRTGLRFGTQAIARKRYARDAIGTLAAHIAAILREGPSEQLKSAVQTLAHEHSELAFCR